MLTMKKGKFILGICALICLAAVFFFVLRTDIAFVTRPKGLIAHREFDLIITNVLLMLCIIIPTVILLFLAICRYRAKQSESGKGMLRQWILWIIPSLVVVVMALITWDATHALDPYKPIESDVKPIKIQVVAMDWKWLFIYPEEGIATLNFLQFPDRTPVHFMLTADGSPMNSFWIPQLSGQIYSMTGMITQLHIMADGPGEYAGRAAEINGEGYADMTFLAKSTSQGDFEAWVDSVKQSPLQLTNQVYAELVKPSTNSVVLFSFVENDLFNTIVKKYLPPQKTWKMSSQENSL